MGDVILRKNDIIWKKKKRNQDFCSGEHSYAEKGILQSGWLFSNKYSKCGHFVNSHLPF